MSESDVVNNPLVGFLRRRWAAVLMAAVVAVGAAVVVSQLLATQTYTFSGTMLYNRTMVGAPHYQQPEVQSIVGLVKSQPVLAAAAKQLHRDGQLAALAAGIQAEVLAGSSTIQFTMRGGEPKGTQAALDAVMGQVAEQAGALRRRTVQQILVSQDAHAANIEEEAAAAAEKLAQFNTRNKVIISVDDDLERVRDDIAAAETALETQASTRENPEEALQRRRTFLQEQQNAEREQIVRAGEIELKQNEFERAARLHAKRYISDAEFRRIETEYQSLRAQTDQSFQQRQAKLNQLAAELEAQFGKPTAAGAATPGPSKAGDEVAVRINGFLQQRRAEAERLNALRTEAAELQRAVTSIQAEVQRSAGLRASYQELRDADYHDLAILQPAVPALDPVTSNGKKLLAGAAIAIFFVLLAPLLAWDFLMRRSTGAAVAAQALRLPLIHSTTPGVAAAADDKVRTLALRIQQSARESGSVALFADVADDAASASLAVAVAGCLSQRGETVLVVETATQPAQRKLLQAELVAPKAVGAESAVVADWLGAGAAPAGEVSQAGKPPAVAAVHPSAGLAELLAQHEFSAVDVVRRGRQFDVLFAGERPLPPEAFAGRRLTEVLLDLQRRYSTIVVLGPDAAHTVDLEMLAARVSSLVFVASKDGAVSSAAQRTIDNLNTLAAPILGLVTV